MWWTIERADAVTGGIWLIGLGILFATGAWWPGILVLAGIATIVEGSARGGGWPAIHGGVWLLLIAGWVAVNFNIGALSVGMGLDAFAAALLRRDPSRKPHFDNTLE